ncbi:MAG: histidine phosphatase family protein [Myxococcota bacterium]
MTSHRASDVRPHDGGQAATEEQRRGQARSQLVLLRHGEPDWVPDGVRAVSDAGLTAFGAAQARAAALAIARDPVDAIYVSPLRRAQETARPLAELSGIPAVTVDGLAEIGVDTGGMTQSEADRFFVEAMGRPLKEFWDGFPGGESFHAFHDRVTRALGKLLARHDLISSRHEEFTTWQAPPRTQNLVIVAHGGTNAVLLTHLLDARPVPWEWLRFEMELAAYAVVRARPVGEQGCVWSLTNFNEIDPLRSAGLR